MKSNKNRNRILIFIILSGNVKNCCFILIRHPFYEDVPESLIANIIWLDFLVCLILGKYKRYIKH